VRVKDVSELPEQMRAQALRKLNAFPSAPQLQAPAPEKRNKYGNEPTANHASAREARRAEALRLRALAGEITELREQVPFELLPAQYEGGECIERSCSYVADFVYTDVASGKQVVEDAKGYRDPVYRIKRKLMLRVHGIRILET
jgi:hypothetical protein